MGGSTLCRWPLSLVYMQDITTDKEDWSQEHRDMTALVVCGDMLIVFIPFPRELYRLDVSTEPATVLPMEKLDDWALFLGAEPNGMPLSCMSPPGKMGREEQHLVLCRLWLSALDRYSDPWAIRWYGEQDPVELALPLWPYPSMFYYRGVIVSVRLRMQLFGDSHVLRNVTRIHA
ncbi:hypothetical protein TRIUR3_04979 [Triticum urartu]|uniref:Uncharacterized protein n=1 Tax=Triticum urartu TaxID=4572 RepID=M7ZJR6_TRIUA|nr:hypothetical protein TRIUR3_04979 [Triticum urartu]